MHVQLHSLSALATHLEIVTKNNRQSHGWTYDEEIKMLHEAAAELKLLRASEQATMKLAEHIESLAKDKARLDALEETIRNCPGADLAFNNDIDDESVPCGFSLSIDACEKSCAVGETLRECLDAHIEELRKQPE